jgi:hypothetical protein
MSLQAAAAQIETGADGNGRKFGEYTQGRAAKNELIDRAK